MKLIRIAALTATGSLCMPLIAQQKFTPEQMAARRLHSDL
jgi:hypothetical protein